jgi:hypothetical protein
MRDLWVHVSTTRSTSGGDSLLMLLIGLTMLVVLVLAGLVTVYVAYPSRGQSIPHASWLSAAMIKARDKLDA